MQIIFWGLAQSSLMLSYNIFLKNIAWNKLEAISINLRDVLIGAKNLDSARTMFGATLILDSPPPAPLRFSE